MRNVIYRAWMFSAEACDRLPSNASNERARLRLLAELGVLSGAVFGAAGMWKLLHGGRLTSPMSGFRANRTRGKQCPQ